MVQNIEVDVELDVNNENETNGISFVRVLLNILQFFVHILVQVLIQIPGSIPIPDPSIGQILLQVLGQFMLHFFILVSFQCPLDMEFDIGDEDGNDNENEIGLSEMFNIALVLMLFFHVLLQGLIQILVLRGFKGLI